MAKAPKARVENVKDLLDKASRFISFDDFVRKFNVDTNFLEYCKVVSTLTRSDKKTTVEPRYFEVPREMEKKFQIAGFRNGGET